MSPARTPSNSSTSQINPLPALTQYLVFSTHGCSSSPEILIQGNGNELYTSPIKGTKPRGNTKSEDLELIKELIECPKERAEHLMLVDL